MPIVPRQTLHPDSSKKCLPVLKRRHVIVHLSSSSKITNVIYSLINYNCSLQNSISMHNLKAVTAESIIYKNQKVFVSFVNFVNNFCKHETEISGLQLLAIELSCVQELVFLQVINLKHPKLSKLIQQITANFKEIYLSTFAKVCTTDNFLFTELHKTQAEITSAKQKLLTSMII